MNEFLAHEFMHALGKFSSLSYRCDIYTWVWILILILDVFYVTFSYSRIWALFQYAHDEFKLLFKGVQHEQSRHDRDDYVVIDVTHVNPYYHHNFDKFSSNETVNYSPYEYGKLWGW